MKKSLYIFPFSLLLVASSLWTGNPDRQRQAAGRHRCVQPVADGPDQRRRRAIDHRAPDLQLHSAAGPGSGQRRGGHEHGQRVYTILILIPF